MSVGVHYPWTAQGAVFSQSANGTSTGLAIPIFSNTAAAGGMPIWNPPNSGVYVELISVDLSYGGGTAGFGSIGLMAGELQSIGTATGCSVFTATTPQNGLLMQGQASKVRSSNAGTVTVTAGIDSAPTVGTPGAGWVRSMFSINLEAETATAHGTSSAKYTFDGTSIVPPGVIVYLAGSVASVALYCTTIVWKEIPIQRVS